jgi:hypothetical protein
VQRLAILQPPNSAPAKHRAKYAPEEPMVLTVVMVLPNDIGTGHLFTVIPNYETEARLAKESQLTRFQLRGQPGNQPV